MGVPLTLLFCLVSLKLFAPASIGKLEICIDNSTLSIFQHSLITKPQLAIKFWWGERGVGWEHTFNYSFIHNLTRTRTLSHSKRLEIDDVLCASWSWCLYTNKRKSIPGWENGGALFSFGTRWCLLFLRVFVELTSAWTWCRVVARFLAIAIWKQ